MSQMGDISLVAQVVVFHNTRAFDQLVKKYQSPVRRFFLHQTCGDSELSDDLAQDTFIKAYTKTMAVTAITVSEVLLPRSNPFQSIPLLWWVLHFSGALLLPAPFS